MFYNHVMELHFGYTAKDVLGKHLMEIMGFYRCACRTSLSVHDQHAPHLS
jgi:hypothetical protein